MLAAIRNAVRRQPRLAASISVSAPRRAADDGMEEIEGALYDEAGKQEAVKKAGVGHYTSRDLESPYKPFRPNHFIRPHDLTYNARLKKELPIQRRPRVGPSKREARREDWFYQLNIDPLSQVLNPALLNHYVSEMGKIYGRNVTKLTAKSQRRLGKAIRRAKMMGMMPVLSRRNILDPADFSRVRSK